MTPLESVPNVSEGRDPAVVAALAAAFSGSAHLLDVHSDADHHRSVLTLVADDDALVDSLVAGIAAAASLVDLTEHTGIHPRVGAADVVPLVPLDGDMGRARRAALEVGRRVGGELGLPVFLYGESGGGRRPAFFRRGGPDELQRRVDAGELAPDFGPARLHPTAGAVLVGARPLLVAFNLELAEDDLAAARAIAAAVRTSSGGMPGVQALGLRLPSTGTVQVSLNVIDVAAAPLADVVARVREEAAARGVTVARGELVGLLPEAAAAPAGALALEALPDDRVLERRLRALGL
ncbi:FtcD: glutamate formiminotransferase [Gaiella occulta]|uniref:glutamate formimidoyltransferase n=1 Tax=Gaiella occulta TaxID=1002870 RepID=A0A7M2YY07_9ACTN|nr:glutamate formimidoyltransferase [Gaiella occulta]RDI75035.1 FtcD: glutamate formiminotransferase [Gaiella occulta]